MNTAFTSIQVLLNDLFKFMKFIVLLEIPLVSKINNYLVQEIRFNNPNISE